MQCHVFPERFSWSDWKKPQEKKSKVAFFHLSFFRRYFLIKSSLPFVILSNFCLLHTQDERKLKSLINWATKTTKDKGKSNLFLWCHKNLVCGLISNLQSTNTLTGTQVTNPWTYIRFAIWIRWQGLDIDEHRCERCLQIKKNQNWFSKYFFKQKGFSS